MPQKIILLVGIVPYIHVQSAIYHASYGKFNRGYQYGACKATQEKTFVSHLHVDEINEQKRQSSRQHHRPMSVAAKKYLNQTVNNTAEAENSKIFSHFIMQKNHL